MRPWALPSGRWGIMEATWFKWGRAGILNFATREAACSWIDRHKTREDE